MTVEIRQLLYQKVQTSLISYDFFNYVANQSVFWKSRILQVMHFCGNIWKSKFWSQKDLNFLHVWMHHYTWDEMDVWDLCCKCSGLFQKWNSESTMALQEFDSFICKFKNLLKAGRSTSLRMTSSAGKAEVHLSVELDDAPLVTLLHPRSRNGPARKRRHEKRAAACEAVEKELFSKAATVELSAKESDMEKVIAEQAAVGKS